MNRTIVVTSSDRVQFFVQFYAKNAAHAAAIERAERRFAGGKHAWELDRFGPEYQRVESHDLYEIEAPRPGPRLRLVKS